MRICRSGTWGGILLADFNDTLRCLMDAVGCRCVENLEDDGFIFGTNAYIYTNIGRSKVEGS